MNPRLMILMTCLAASLAAQGDLSWVDHPDPGIRERGLRAVKRREVELDVAIVNRLLADADWGVQLEAIRTFDTYENEGVRRTMASLAIDGALLRIRRAAAEALGTTDRAGAARALLKFLDSVTGERRLRTIEALGFVGSPAAEKALSILSRSSDEATCRVAARALGRARLGEKALIRSLGDKRLGVVAEAAAALATIDTDTARRALIEWAVRHDEPWVLRRIGVRSAETDGEAMGKVIAARLAKTRRPYGALRVAWEGRLHEAAAAARAHRGHPDPLTRGYAWLVGALSKDGFDAKSLGRGLGDRDERVRRAVAQAQVLNARLRDGLPDGLPPLLEHRAPEVAMAGIRAAFEQEVREVFPALVGLANGAGAGRKSWEVRCAAAVAAGRVGGLGAMAPLTKLAAHKDWRIRGAALEGLARTMQGQAIDVLIAAHDDRHPVPRRVARRNLHWLSGGRTQPTKKRWRSWWSGVKEGYVPKPPRAEEPDIGPDDGYDRRVPRDYVRRLLNGTDITVVLGRWDRIQLVLQDLQVDHAFLRGQQIKDRGVWPKETVVVNCEGSLDKTTNEYLRWMVVCGGWMATSDWALTNAVKRTFPDVIHGHVKQSTGNDVVKIDPVAPRHPFLKDVLRKHVDYTWWLEIQAFPISVHDPFRATVLVDSLEMRLRYGQDTMMATFPAGLGNVLHTTSHFYLQQEGFAKAAGSRTEREVFAIDHLGISVANVRALRARGGLSSARNTTAISRDYSMFRMLVNFIREKKRADRR